MKINKNIIVAVIAVVLVIGILVIERAVNRPPSEIIGFYSTNQSSMDSQNISSPAVLGKFPSLHLTSSYDPFAVERSFWHSGTLSLANHADAFENVDIRIRGRGNSTWHFGEEKRPLRLRFETPQSFLGSDYIARDWVLISNHFDLTLMRTYLAFYLASLLNGLDWTSSAQFVHLYINGEYVGVYQVSDERDIQPGRMQLIFDENPAVSEYLFELDHSAINNRTEGVEFFFADGRPYDIRYPRNDRLSIGHVEYMQDFVENIAEVLRSRDFAAISAVMDIPSFVDFYLVQELFKNTDVGYNSVFMQVRGQGEDRRLYWGPVWDFDRSAGNMYYWHDYHHLHAAVRNHFMRYLMTTPEIFALVAERWEEISENQVKQMIAHIEYLAYTYEAEFARNFEAFPVWEAPLPSWMTKMLPTHLHEIDSWSGQIEFLLEWFEGRIWWMNQMFIYDKDLREWWLDYLEPQRDFPSLSLNLPEHPFLQERTHRQRGSVSLTNTATEFAFRNENISVRGRGNTTWRYGEDKRPLRIRFDEPRTFLDSEYAHREWILLANHFDRSLLRNHGAFYLANLLDGMDWSPFSRFVHLYINGKYYGVYELTEERDIAPGRVNITFDADPTISEYFFELNGHVRGWRATEYEEGIHYFIVNGRFYELRWPSVNMREQTHLDYVQNYVQNVSDAIRTHNWDEIMRLIDIPSFIDFYIVQELFKNADIWQFSVFMQIRGQGENRHLYMGPVWDFDQSSGNNSYVENPRGRLVERDHYWYNYLMQMPAFRSKVTERWDEVKDSYIPQTITHIRYMGETYAHAFQRNFDKHPNIMGDVFEWNWVQSYATAAINNFPGQVDFLADFLTVRKQWMDDFLHDRLPTYEYRDGDSGEHIDERGDERISEYEGRPMYV